jgi:hypothetical protein
MLRQTEETGGRISREGRREVVGMGKQTLERKEKNTQGSQNNRDT